MSGRDESPFTKPSLSSSVALFFAFFSAWLAAVDGLTGSSVLWPDTRELRNIFEKENCRLAPSGTVRPAACDGAGDFGSGFDLGEGIGFRLWETGCP